MSEFPIVEHGRMGRVAYARIAPNEDLVQSVEKLCLARQFRHAFVRGALGSLVDACLGRSDGTSVVIHGPVEIVSLAGEVHSHPDGSLRGSLSGVVVDTHGRVHGGPFVPGGNLVCMTFEVMLEEWLPESEAGLSAHSITQKS